MSKFHEIASENQHAQMLTLITQMEGEIANEMDMSIPSAIIAIQQMTVSQLAMLDTASAAALLRETARLIVQEIDEAEFGRRITPLMDRLIAEYEWQADVNSH